MIRKIIIAVLTLAAFGTTYVGLESRETPLRTRFVEIGELSLCFHFRGFITHLIWTRLHPVVTIAARDEWENVYAHNEKRSWSIRFTLLDLRQIRRLDLGFHGVFTKKNSDTSSLGFLRTPIWTPVIILIAYPTLAFIRGPLRRYRRRKRGVCVTCGYDLRGSPERCPECGTEIASA